MHDQNAAILTIDLAAIAANYRHLRQMGGSAACGAAVKADGYGLGAAQIAPILYQAGCRDFFVATLDEGLDLRSVIADDARISVLNGLSPGAVGPMLQGRLTPVLNGPRDVEIWSAWDWHRQTDGATSPPPAVLQVDSGMSRLGFGARDWDRLLATDFIERFPVSFVISHLGCSDSAMSPMNASQLSTFHGRLRATDGRLSSETKYSLAASSGIFLGADYHFDLVRPGGALYGANPLPDMVNPMRQVLRLQGKILQVHDVDAGTLVGYGGAHKCVRSTRIATIGCGYADGLLRALSGQGAVHVGDHRVPIIGRLSMDMFSVDVGDLPPDLTQPGMTVDIIGPHQGIDALALSAGSNAYEMLAALGPRYNRVYQTAGIS